VRISPSPILKFTAPTDSLFKAYSASTGQNIGDARDRAAPIVMQAGNPQGQLQVAGLKGKFWGQRPLPSGGSTTMMFYMPSDEDNNPIEPGAEDLAPGDSILVQPNSDTQPLTWRYNMRAGKQYSGWEVQTSPCSNPNGSVCWGSEYPCPGFPKTTYSPGSSPFHHVNTTGGSTGHTTTARRSDNPPVSPADAYMWQNPENEVTYRWDNNATKWFVQSGRTSGTFVVRQCAVNITAGQVCAESSTDGVVLADNTTLAQFGKVIGVAVESGTTGQFIVIQASGDFAFTNFYTSSAKLYLDTAGGLTVTPPTLNGSGSQLIFQQIAIAKSGYLTIALGTPILTLANSTATPVIIPSSGGDGLEVGVPPGSGYAANFGDNTNTVFTITHSLGTRDVMVVVYRNSSPWDEIECDIEHTSTSVVTLTLTPIPTTDEFRVVVKP
jgi:hypothetical protein